MHCGYLDSSKCWKRKGCDVSKKKFSTCHCRSARGGATKNTSSPWNLISFHTISDWIASTFINQIRLQVIEFFHSSRLIRRIEQKKNLQFGDMTRDWTQIACLAVKHFNHYTRMFSVLVWGCNWMLFMHGWFCPVPLIHLIGLKSLHYEKN